MNRSAAALFVGLALPAALACPAAAQVAGTYHGTGSNGASVYFIIAKDAGSGAVTVTNMTLYDTQACSDRSTAQFGTGFNPNAPLVDGKARNTTATQTFTVAFSLNFASNGRKASGKVYSYGAKLDPIGSHPKRALVCSSAQQDFDVKLQANPNVELPAAPEQGWVSLGKVYHAPVGPPMADAPE